MRTPISNRTRIAGVAVALAAALGAILFATRPSAAPTPPPSAMNRPSAARTPSFGGLSQQPVSQPAASAPSARAPAPAGDTAAPDPPSAPPGPEPANPEEYLKNPNKDPITPPVIEVEARPVDGSVLTSEPITPPVIILPDPVAMDSAAVTAAPLTPPVIVVHGSSEDP